jgi:hypothetical protein
MRHCILLFSCVTWKDHRSESRAAFRGRGQAREPQSGADVIIFLFTTKMGDFETKYFFLMTKLYHRIGFQEISPFSPEIC